ncbi:MAG: hypothetical protein ACI88C_000862 [Acidimicrobiales bacterium]|jgi:hypothetical protein
MIKERYDIPVEPKAGKVGTLAVFLFGVLSILAVFIAAYMWTDADTKLAGAVGVASIVIPSTIGYFFSEVRHQRSGALWFVLSAAVLAGAMGAWALNEREAFEDRRDLIAPEAASAPLSS